jgi:hypothetical protein
VKAGMIFARKSTWRSRLDLEYLDETSERKVSQRQRNESDVKKCAHRTKAQAIRGLRLKGNARTGSRGWIPSSHDSD